MALPRLLIADFTPMHGTAATSRLKANHFGDWPADRCLQVTLDPATAELALGTSDGRYRAVNGGQAAAQALDQAFAPQIILYRPTSDSPKLHSFVQSLLQTSKAALVLWLMDDWPAQLMAEDRKNGQYWDDQLKALSSRAQLALAISPTMAVAFEERYGLAFETASNFVELPSTPPRARRAKEGQIRLRYAGSLSPEMSLAAVDRLARFVENDAGRALGLHFDIRTQDHWFELYGHQFSGRDHVSIQRSDLSAAEYEAWLSDADVLVAAYNDDETTKRYLRYSFANKIPELLSSGRPVIAIGPKEIETIRFLKETGAAAVVLDPGDRALEEALRSLCIDAKARERLAEAAFDVAKAYFSAESGKQRLRQKLVAIAAPRPEPASSALHAAKAVSRDHPANLSLKVRIAIALASVPAGAAVLRGLSRLRSPKPRR
ncbi:MAG: hypothetical protein AAFR65_15465 [Pseudomonadota bacterium]